MPTQGSHHNRLIYMQKKWQSGSRESCKYPQKYHRYCTEEVLWEVIDNELGEFMNYQGKNILQGFRLFLRFCLLSTARFYLRRDNPGSL
jgi:hypothetical protein